MAAGEFYELAVVGDLVEGEGAVGVGVFEVKATDDLRGLHGPEGLARDGAIDGGGEGAGRLFDGEMDGEGGDGRAVFVGGD